MVDVDVRVVAATHRDLQREIEGGRFLQRTCSIRLQVLTVEIRPCAAGTGTSGAQPHFLERIAAGRGKSGA
jgi:transcriptional regulator of acetoin/glycerol metabolism